MGNNVSILKIGNVIGLPEPDGTITKAVVVYKILGMPLVYTHNGEVMLLSNDPNTGVINATKFDDVVLDALEIAEEFDNDFHSALALGVFMTALGTVIDIQSIINKVTGNDDKKQN